jgi:hypothetical protein
VEPGLLNTKRISTRARAHPYTHKSPHILAYYITHSLSHSLMLLTHTQKNEDLEPVQDEEERERLVYAGVRGVGMGGAGVLC